MVLYSLLDRLIRLGSQRLEHSGLGFDERLEFEVRLAEAEAEAVLREAERMLGVEKLKEREKAAAERDGVPSEEELSRGLAKGLNVVLHNIP